MSTHTSSLFGTILRVQIESRPEKFLSCSAVNRKVERFHTLDSVFRHKTMLWMKVLSSSAFWDRAGLPPPHLIQPSAFYFGSPAFVKLYTFTVLTLWESLWNLTLQSDLLNLYISLNWHLIMSIPSPYLHTFNNTVVFFYLKDFVIHSTHRTVPPGPWTQPAQLSCYWSV